MNDDALIQTYDDSIDEFGPLARGGGNEHNAERNAVLRLH